MSTDLERIEYAIDIIEPRGKASNRNESSSSLVWFANRKSEVNRRA